MVMGTIGYMSPEQVRGQEAGPASDIFALGCLLYEMASGRAAFAAGTSTEGLAAVLRDEPAPIGGVSSDFPPTLEPLIRHCLEKQASDRFQSASDFAFALRTVLGDARSTGSVSPSPEGVAARRVWRLPLAIVFGAVVGAASSTLWRTSAPASAGVVQLTWPLAAGLALAPNDSPAAGSSVAISRDGQWIAAIVQRSGQRFLAMRGIDRPDGTILPGTQGALTPVFSPDSRWVAFFTETDLRKVPIAGGTPTVLGPVPPVARGATWADDDNIYFSPSFSDGLWRMSASGGPMTVVSDVDFKSGESNHLLPEALPGARALLFTVWKGGDFSASQIWSLSLVSRERKLLLDAATAPRYVSPGFLVFARGGGLFAIRFDVTRLTTTGAAIPIVDGVWTDHLTGTAHYAVSPSGALVYAAGAGTVERRRLVWVDRHGGTQLLAGEPSFYANPRISPDGLKVAVEALNDLWIYDLGKTTLTRISFRGVNQLPVWSPDGRRIAVSSSHGVAVPTLFLVDADVAGTLKPISRAGLVEFPASWSRAGNVLAYAARRPFDTDTGWDVWVMHPGDDTPARALIQTPFKDDQPMLGPNGRALAYVSDETGRLEVYVQPYPSLGRRVRISTTGGTEPVWSRRGTELFYRSGRQYFSVPVSQAGETITVGRPFLMFEGDYVVSSIFPGVPSYDVSPDGQRFLAVARASDTPRIERLEVVLEWPRELERRLTPGGR
jgi:Tol biopolymer transport system component